VGFRDFRLHLAKWNRRDLNMRFFGIGLSPRGCGSVAAALLALGALGAGAAPASAANANFHLGKTVTGASDTPVLALALAVDRSAAIPRDSLTYTAVVTNAGSVVQLAGDLTAQNTDATTAVVASYFDAVSTAANSHCGAGGSNDGQNTSQWTPVAGTAAASNGYSPVQAAPIASGLSLSLTPVPAAGVVYPASGDPILGTQIAPGAQATWHYTATISLSPAQTVLLLDPAQTTRIRNTFHAEPVPRDQSGHGSPATINVDFCQQLFASQPSGTVSNVTVTITPRGAAPVALGPAAFPGLAALAPGASVLVSAQSLVPVPASKQAGESDATYLARLTAIEGSQLVGTATAVGTGATGQVSAPPAISGPTTEHVPVVHVAKSGPTSADAGTTATYPIALQNTGGANAGPLAVGDSVGGAAGPVVGVPASLAPSAGAAATATFAIPASQPGGPLTDVAAATWQDANGNGYGPVSSSFTTQVRPIQVTPAAAISTGPVVGNFYFKSASQTVFGAKPGDIPAFRQTFTTLNFNPPEGVVNHNVSGVGPTTRPFTDVTTDGAGNFAGTVVAQGNGLQAGVGTLASFDAVFTSTFVVAKPGDITFNVLANDGFLLGVGSGATRVSGVYEGAPASNTSPFSGYPLVGAWNQTSGGAVGTYPITIHFPAAGVYPYELDYFDCCGQPLSLTLSVAGFNEDTQPLSVYVGYADGLRPAGSIFPFPWKGSPGVTFLGGTGSGFDAGAIRFDNNSDQAIVFDDVAVDIGPFHFDIWGNHIVVQPHGITILTQTGDYNLDTSDAPATCSPDGYIPQIHVTQAGVTTSFSDSNRIINTGGIDPAACGGGNESHPWERIGGGGVGINVPLPPAVTMSLSPATSPGQTVGSTQTLTVAVLDVGGQPVPGLVVEFGVFGANAQTLRATTDAGGFATASYTGLAAGTDTITATAFVSGLQAVSNTLRIDWAEVSPPVVQGWIGAPLDGSTATGTVPITVGAGVTLVQWTVEISPATNPSAVTVLATGAQGGPGATLSTLDTTLLANGNYVIRLRATDSNGQQLVSQVTITVAGENKPGRLILDVTDLTVPAAGIPITIKRRYDSLERNQVGDFGYGWSLEVAGPRLEVSPDYAVTITEPGTGRRVTFQFAPTAFGFPFNFLYQPTYVAEPGVYGKLASDGCDPLLRTSTGVACYLSSDPTYRPTVYTYTDPYGRVYTMTAAGKMQSIKDLNGNVLTFSPAGITSSSGGLNVPFVRDAQGRITQITDPEGQTFRYSYDEVGDLSTVELPGVSTPVSYTYEPGHYFRSSTDPRGNTEASSTYYVDGRLASFTDAVGNTTSYDYDLAANKTLITYPDGGVATFEYDASGLLLSETDPLNHSTTYTYDSNRNKLTETNALGQTTSHTYDANGNLTSTTDPAGRMLRWTYNPYGTPATATDQLGNVQTTQFDATFNPVSIADSLGIRVAFTWDSHGNPLTSTDGNAKVMRFTYYTHGSILTKTDPLGRTISYTYDEMGRVLTMADARGTIRSTYDALGRLLTLTDPLEQVTRFEYDDNGNKTAQVDAAGKRTSYQYDAANRLTKVTNPDSTVLTYTYSFRGQRLTETDQDRRTTTYVYDTTGRRVKVVNPDLTEITYTYDALNRVTSKTDERNHMTRYEYDPGCGCRERLTKLIDPLGRATTYGFDAAGRLASERDANQQETRFGYDVRNRLIQTTYADGTTTRQRYDGAGHKLTEVDQADRVTQFGYDDVGNLVSVTDALNQVTIHSYDALNSLLSTTDALGHVTSYEYDPLNRLIKRVLPLGMFESFTYDPVGNRVTRTDFGGKQTHYDYDPMNRLINKTPDASLGEPSVSYTYNPAGQRASMTDESGTTLYTYDARHRLSSKQTPQGTLSYTYDAAGNVASVRSSNANGVSVDYTYDALDRLESVVDNRLANGTTTYSYDAVGNTFRATLANGVQTAYAYDSLYRSTEVTHSRGAVLANYMQALDLTGRRLSISESNGRVVNYTYDALHRLTGETVSGNPAAAGNGTVTYTYDPVGNRLARTSTLGTVLSSTSAYDANDRLTADTHDMNGNTLSGGGLTYTYDFENRIRSSNGGTTRIVYDGDGGRVSTTVGSVTTRYLVDDLNPSGYSQVLEELVAGSVQRTYTYGNHLISQNQQRNGGWQVSFYGYDAHGNVRFLTDGNGALTDTYTYDAFGILTSSTGTTPNNYLFNGQQYDSDLGLYFQRARYYSQDRGRFMTMDPVAGRFDDPMTLHLYLFGHADPANRIDPLGTTDLAEEGLTSSLVALRTAPALVVLGSAIACVVYHAASAIDPEFIPPGIFQYCAARRDDDRDTRCQEQLNQDEATCRRRWPWDGTNEDWVKRDYLFACLGAARQRYGECLATGEPRSPLSP
jgi:RHS repeat-associated protein